MRVNFRSISITILLIVAVLTQVLWPLPFLGYRSLSQGGRGAFAGSYQAASGMDSVYLPLVRSAPGPPAFEITSPKEGWTVSGMLYFAAQPSDPTTVSSVTFLAGGTELGSDDTPEDGYRAFLNTSAFPAGSLQLTAIASGPGGDVAKSVMVNVEPNPPASSVVGSEGGVLASEIGSIITIPPGALPDGTTVSVDEMSQEEVTAATGFDWKSKGVTFLGAQDVQSSAAFSQPLGVASADFGNRVQPGQVVVNYRIVPDANGDGIDELIVVNTASVAPNNDVISDPVPQVLLSDEVTTFNARGSTTRGLSGGISGPPGTLIELEAEGFNPYSPLGNVAVFRSLVDGTEIELQGNIYPDLEDDVGQVFTVVIPVLPPGPATLVLRNESTGSTVGPIEIIVETPTPISQPADQIIDDYFVQSLAFIAEMQSTLDEEHESLNRTMDELSEARTLFNQLKDDPAPEVQGYLSDVATMIVNSGIMTELSGPGTSARAALADCVSQSFINTHKFMLNVSEAMFVLGCGLLAIGNPIAGLLCGAGGVLAVEAIKTFLLDPLKPCEDPPPEPPPIVCPTSPTSSGAGITGMGSAPPPGGDGCGWIGTGPPPIGPPPPGLREPAGSPFTLEPGRFVVVGASTSGVPFAFSGMTDAGGYFFLPFLAEGAPFTAIAYDTLTGDCRTVEGVGPATGESVLLPFDFQSGACVTGQVHWDGGGDGSSWNDPLNWDTDVLPGPTDRVFINVPGDITVTHAVLSTSMIFSLHSEENIKLSFGTLDIAASSVITGTFVFEGQWLRGAGDVTFNGPLIWKGGGMAGSGKTIANGGIDFPSMGGSSLGEGRTLDNAATANLSSTLSISGGAVFNNLPTATFVMGDANVSGVQEATFNNFGRFTRSSASGGFQYVDPLFINSGVVDIQSGRVVFSNYIQDAAGVITVEIGGLTPFTEYDRYEILDLATLDGTLEIILVDGYEPQIGDTFEIMVGLSGFADGMITGEFAAVNGLEIGNGKRFEVIYSAKSVTLEVVAVAGE